MPGRPKLLALRKRIADDHLEDEIFEEVAEGTPIGKMCEKFGITSRKMFYDWKGKDGDRHEKYLAARTIAAEAHAELAGAILDDLGDEEFLTGPMVQAASSRSKYQQWLAGVKDRDQFGSQDKGVQIAIGFGEMHFEQLRLHRPDAIQAIEVETDPENEDESIPEADYVEEGVGNEGEATAHTGHENEPITPPAPTLAAALQELL